LLLAREISITALRSIASTEGLIIASDRTGKQKTAFQMAGILCLMLGYPYHLALGPLDLGVVDLVLVGRALVYLSLVYSLVSAFQYLAQFARAIDAQSQE